MVEALLLLQSLLFLGLFIHPSPSLCHRLSLVADDASDGCRIHLYYCLAEYSDTSASQKDLFFWAMFLFTQMTCSCIGFVACQNGLSYFEDSKLRIGRRGFMMSAQTNSVEKKSWRESWIHPRSVEAHSHEVIAPCSLSKLALPKIGLVCFNF